ncbi:Wadjet anti-phage system protein JetD domain-containing protein [Afipia birgiae]|uniref:Wadjet anti-phage system protein JetD domain-containing protein n=1 Tax=Afipia birgiae TaxID=151414 RepID=UPI0002F2DAA7|nr:Wadjet anti-phage system protein JetD domain-containing protein [Afipia birgiae]
MSASKARDILGTLLDRVERVPDRTRQPAERAPADFPSAAERAAFDRLLADAERQGAISVVKGRGEAQHLTERIRLRDAVRLYEFLGRIPAVERARAAVSRLWASVAPKHTDAVGARDSIIDGWLRGQRPFSISFEQADQAVEFITALDAVLARDPMDRRDLRTYSGQTTGNTKLLERYASRIINFLKQIGRLDADLSDNEAMASLGLEKFSQPVLLAGPVRLAGVDLAGLVYVGLPPEQAPAIEPAGAIRSIITIENLASFNRHVREALQADDVVVYTGGFPSRAVAAALVAISRWPGITRIHHWGDIDEGGLRIALHLTSLVSIPVLPHLMSPALARLHGSPGKASRKIDLLPGHPWQSLATFLGGDDARFLEQEKIDPVPTTTVEAVS